MRSGRRVKHGHAVSENGSCFVASKVVISSCFIWARFQLRWAGASAIGTAALAQAECAFTAVGLSDVASELPQSRAN